MAPLFQQQQRFLCPFQVLLLTVTVFLTLESVTAQYYCDLREEPVRQITWNDSSNHFEVVHEGYHNDGHNNNNNNSRSLKTAVLLSNGDGSHANHYNLRRKLLDDEEEYALTPNDTTAASAIQHGAEGALYEVRQCSCFNRNSRRFYDSGNHDLFCPADRSHCMLPYGYINYTASIRDIHCVTVIGQRRFARSIFPILLVWYGVLLSLLLCTAYGRQALACCLSSMCKDFNKFLANQLMRNHPNYVDYIVAVYLERRRILLDRRSSNNNNNNNNNNNDNTNGSNNDNPNNNEGASGDGLDEMIDPPPPRIPTQLQLKTRIFYEDAAADNKENSDDDDGANDTTNRKNSHEDTFDDDEYDEDDLEGDGCGCIICHTEISNGDRVGVLPCTHVMHVDCLKGWLKRRNVCPLCLAENIATPQYDPVVSNNNNDNNDDDNNADGDDNNNDNEVDNDANHATATTN